MSAPPMGNLEETGWAMFGWLGQAVRQGEGDAGRVPPGCVPPFHVKFARAVRTDRQTAAASPSRWMGGVTGPGIDVVVVVSTHPREEDQENERKKKDGTCRRPKETPKIIGLERSKEHPNSPPRNAQLRSWTGNAPPFPSAGQMHSSPGSGNLVLSDTRQRFGMEGETPKLMGSERKWPAIAKKKLSEKKEESSLPFEKETGNPSGGSAGAVVCMNLWRETMLARSLGAGLVGLLDEPSSRHARMPDWRAACIHALPTYAAGGSWEGMGAPVCSPMLPLPEQSRGSRGLSLSSQNHTYNQNVCAYSPEYGWGPPRLLPFPRRSVFRFVPKTAASWTVLRLQTAAAARSWGVVDVELRLEPRESSPSVRPTR